MEVQEDGSRRRWEVEKDEEVEEDEGRCKNREQQSRKRMLTKVGVMNGFTI